MNTKSYQEGGHYYDRLGNPCYEQPLKDDPARFRPTHIGDCVKEDLVVSVTTIIKQTVANKRLEIYKENQLTNAFLSVSRSDGEENYDYVARVKIQASEHSKEARERGAYIHNLIEQYLLSLMRKQK